VRSGCCPLPANLKLVEQVLGGRGDGGNGLLEGLGVMAGRSAESTDLPDVLERGGTDIGIGDVLGERLAESLDAAAHR
jgi:hypothetical protein